MTDIVRADGRSVVQPRALGLGRSWATVRASAGRPSGGPDVIPGIWFSAA